MVRKKDERLRKRTETMSNETKKFQKIVEDVSEDGSIGAIQVLRNAMGRGGWVSAFPEKCVTRMYSSTLLALRGDGWVSKFQEQRVA